MIRFDKLSMYDRDGEPVSLAVPFAKGQLQDLEAFGIVNGEAIAVQKAVTSTWEDGSVKWLMAHFLADLPGNRGHEMSFAWDGSVGVPELEIQVSVKETDKGVAIDTGPLQVECAREGFDLFRKVVLNGEVVLEPGACSGFYLVDGEGRVFETRQADLDALTVLEAGPLRAVVECSGTHRGETGTLFDFRVLVYAWAGKPWVEVEYQFINREREDRVQIGEIGLKVRPDPIGNVRCAMGEGYYRTSVKEGSGERLLDAETILYQSVEHVLEVFYGDFWADWCDGKKGVSVTPFQAHQNFPKGLKVDKSGIAVEIYPAGQAPVTVLQGVAKTHRFLFSFHDSEMTMEEVTVRSLQFQYPDVAILSEDWYRDSGVWERVFPEVKSLPLEMGVINMADGRNRGLGMLHWGDGPDHGYTQQGRGKGELVWTNNEYDFPHQMFLLFAKTGERRFRDVGLVAAQHWIDVDFCHYSDDPMKMGGQPIHTAGHVTGGVTPSHEWTEGLLDFYYMTGKVEAREKAISIADNMIRHLESPKFAQAGGFAARETGWAMRGLIAVYNETREEKYLDACRKIADQFLEWKADLGAFLAPYTSHTQVRVPFMISIAVNALYRYYDATGDERIPGLIVEEMGDLMDHCVMPDGRFFYKELPSLNRRAGGAREMEALSYAYELSGDERFLDQVDRMMAGMVKRGIGGSGGGKRIVKDLAGDTVLFDGSGPKGFASFYIPFMVAYRTLSEAGRLEGLDG